MSKKCNLCTDTIKPSEEVLHCEGSCGAHMHRYCAGVTKKYYCELVKSSTPFVCLHCTQQLHKAEVRALQSELQALKAEISELRATAEAAAATVTSGTAVAQPMASRYSLTSPADSDELKAIREELDNVKTTVMAEIESLSYAAVTAKGRPRRRNQSMKAAERPARPANPPADAPANATPKTKEKEKVSGARKIWGTLKSTSATAVSTAVTKLTSLTEDDFQVKRKYKQYQKNNSTVLRWWFVIRGSEEVMSKLEDEWEQLSLQTNWKIEPLMKFVTPENTTSF